MKVKPMENDDNQGQIINITVTYIADSTTITLPKGHTFADIEHWYIKWDVFHCQFKDGESFEKDISSDGSDCVDMKRPATTTISSVQDDGITLDEVLAEE